MLRQKACGINKGRLDDKSCPKQCMHAMHRNNAKQAPKGGGGGGGRQLRGPIAPQMAMCLGGAIAPQMA